MSSAAQRPLPLQSSRPSSRGSTAPYALRRIKDMIKNDKSAKSAIAVRQAVQKRNRMPEKLSSMMQKHSEDLKEEQVNALVSAALEGIPLPIKSTTFSSGPSVQLVNSSTQPVNPVFSTWKDFKRTYKNVRRCIRVSFVGHTWLRLYLYFSQ